MCRGAANRALRAAPPWRGGVPLAALLTALGLAAPGPASAQGIAEADRAYADGALAEAGRAYEDALAAGGLSRGEVARAHLRLAALSALGEERARFERHAAAALALDPELPAPLLEAAYAARFSTLAGAARRLRLELSGEGERITVTARGGPGIVQILRLRGAAGWERAVPFRGEPVSLVVPSEARPVFVEGLDRHGNAVVEAGAEAPSAEPAARPAPSAPAPAADDATPLVESPWLWIGVGLLAVGIALVVGLTAFGERYVLDAPVVR